MRIGLLDHMGYGNMGDAATQDALIANIRMRMPSSELVAFSLNPVDTAKRHAIPCYPIRWSHPGLHLRNGASAEPVQSRSRLRSSLKNIPLVSKILRPPWHLARELAHLWKSFRVLRSLDCLVFSGGGQLGELWRGPWAQPYNIFKFSLLTKLAGRGLFFVSVGAGPLESSLGKFFVKWSVAMADYVSFRDIESQQLLNSLGLKRETHVFPDAVYALVRPDTAAAKEQSTGRVVGINPIGFCDPRIWPKHDAKVYARYIDKLEMFSNWLLKQDYELRIFSGEVSVDFNAVKDLEERFAKRLSETELQRIFRPHRTTVPELLQEMSTFDFIITSKFHGVVFSHVLEKPVVALSYYRKIDDLMRTVGHAEYCFDIAEFAVEPLKSAFNSLVANADELKDRFRRSNAARFDALTRQFDNVFGAIRAKEFSGVLARDPT